MSGNRASVTYGDFQVSVKRAYYSGTDVLLKGYFVNYDSTNADVNARNFNVVKPALNNMGHPAGIVIGGGIMGNAGPGYVDIIPWEELNRGIPVWTDESVGAQQLLGSHPGTYAMRPGVLFNAAVARTKAAVDRSVTAGTVDADLMPIGMVSPEELMQSMQVETNDLLSFSSTDWTITETQAAATQAIIDAVGGILRLTNSAADNDINQVQRIGEVWRLSANKPLLFLAKCRIVQDGTTGTIATPEMDFFVGLSVTDTDLVGGVTDFMGFKKDDGDATLETFFRKDSAGNNIDTSLETAVNTWFVCGFYFDGRPTPSVIPFTNGSAIATTNAYQALATATQGTTITGTANGIVDDEELRFTFASQNGRAEVCVVDLDWYVIKQAR